jgi:flagellar basal body-associated protein FliL
MEKNKMISIVVIVFSVVLFYTIYLIISAPTREYVKTYQPGHNAVVSVISGEDFSIETVEHSENGYYAVGVRYPTGIIDFIEYVPETGNVFKNGILVKTVK